MTNIDNFVTAKAIDQFAEDGVCCIRGVFAEWVEKIAAGIETNMREPGPSAAESVTENETGSFFDDYCNWPHIAEFADVVRNSPAAEIAAKVMRSDTAQFFHDHVLVKEPGTSKPTPWHQDIPYYFVEGRQSLSYWIPVDPVDDATLRFIAGSHKWEKMVLPVRWIEGDAFFPGEDEYLLVPDPDSEPGKYRILEWDMEPGDAVLFDFRTVHGARPNMSAARRRAFSMRWLGDDMRYITRPGRTSPPYPGHGMSDGQHLREDWFPILWRR